VTAKHWYCHGHTMHMHIYATMFFTWFEQEQILTKYKQSLKLYCKQIDDIFGIWIPDTWYPNRFKEFKSDLNGYIKLEWNTEELSNSVTFLYLTILLEWNEQGILKAELNSGQLQEEHQTPIWLPPCKRTFL
jgi:hypothetical protein